MRYRVRLPVLLIALVVAAAFWCRLHWLKISGQTMEHRAQIRTPRVKTRAQMCTEDDMYGRLLSYEANDLTLAVFNKAARLRKKGWVPTVPVHIFWHVGSIGDTGHRFEDIVMRQYELLKRSGLWEVANIHIGIVGEEELPVIIQRDILRSERVHNFTHVSSGLECITTNYLHQIAQRIVSKNKEAYIMYIHSRGVTHPATDPTNSWTKAMEYFTITSWKSTTALLAAGASTAGIYKNSAIEWCFPHYSGNFWWAKASYVALLPAPDLPVDELEMRFTCGEAWIMGQDPHRGSLLHFDMYQAPWSYFTPDHYVYDLPPSSYTCPDEIEPIMPTRKQCPEGITEFKRQEAVTYREIKTVGSWQKRNELKALGMLPKFEHNYEDQDDFQELPRVL